MRGKRGDSVGASGALGNIPAYAGKTASGAVGGGGDEEHPRVCGENLHEKFQVAKFLGTSPRMRGKQGKALVERKSEGNIPAYAGKTQRQGACYHWETEHPRVCGENQALKAATDTIPGTSPRMRGKHRLSPSGVFGRRNIPAYAGKTPRKTQSGCLTAEHPRVCGDNGIWTTIAAFSTGTSPRMRGKHLLTCGSSFLKVILHSVLFFCTVGVPWNPLQLPPF